MAGPLSDAPEAAPPWAEIKLLVRALVPRARGAADAGFTGALARMADLDEYVRGRIAESVTELNAREAAKAAERTARAAAARPSLPSRPASLAPSKTAPAARPPIEVRSEYREALVANPSLADALSRLGEKLTGRQPAPRAPVSRAPAPQAIAPSPHPEAAAEPAAFVPSQPPPVRVGFKPASRFRRTFEGVHPIFSDRPTAER